MCARVTGGVSRCTGQVSDGLMVRECVRREVKRVRGMQVEFITGEKKGMSRVWGG